MTLAELMRQLQGEQSVRAFADELGLSPSTLDKIYAGRREPGRRVIRALVAKYPERREQVLSLFLPQKRGQ